MENVETFATPRMNAARISENDYDDLFRLNQDPEVANTMAGTRSESETREFIRGGIEQWKLHGYGYWIFRDRADGRFIGRAGLHHVEIDGAGEVEIAYALMPNSGAEDLRPRWRARSSISRPSWVSATSWRSPFRPT